MQVVIMGVCGSGKTTVGSSLAEKIGCSFSDADEFHSDANKTKMGNGQPLTDEIFTNMGSLSKWKPIPKEQDRFPWLLSIHEFMSRKHKEGQTLVVTCSALKRSYRDILKHGGHRDNCLQNTDMSHLAELQVIQQLPRVLNYEAHSTENILQTQSVTGCKEYVQAYTTQINTFEEQEGTEFGIHNYVELQSNEDGSKRCSQKHIKSINSNDVQPILNGSSHSTQIKEVKERAPNNTEVVQAAQISKESIEKPERTKTEDSLSPIFVHLTGSPAVLEERLSNRQGHFMPKSLLQSQLDALEPLGSDEEGFTVDIDKSLEDVVLEIISSLKDMKHGI